MAGFGVASALCALAPSVGWLIAFRVLQGLAAAAISPQPLVLIRRTFESNERGRALGIWGAVAAAGTLLGPLLGGILVTFLDWRWIFIVNVPVCVAAVAVGAATISRSPGRVVKFDWLGGLTSTAAMGLLVWAMLDFQTVPPASIALSLVLSAGLFAWFIRRSRRLGANALTPIRLFRAHSFNTASVGMGALGGVVIAMTLPAMLYFQNQRGLDTLESALILVPDAVVAAVLSPAAGRWVDRTNPRTPAIVGMGFLVLSMLLFGLVVCFGVSPWWATFAAAVLGVANAIAWSPLSAAAMNAVETELAGAASGVFNTVRQVGAVLCVALVGVILEWPGSGSLGAYVAVFAFLSAVALAGALASTRLPRSPAAITGSPSPTKRPETRTHANSEQVDKVD